MKIEINQNELMEIVSKALGYPVKYMEVTYLKIMPYKRKKLLFNTLNEETLKELMSMKVDYE